MNTEKWLEDEGYPMVMSISRSSLADIILRFIHVHGLNPKEPETVHGNEEEKEVCPDCGDLGWIDTDENGGRKTCPCHY